MTCSRCHELASEALDGTMDAATEAEFRAHLTACRPCSAFSQDLRSSLALLTELPRIQVDDSFDRAVWARVRASGGERPSLWHRWREMVSLPPAWRWGPVAAAACLMLALGLSSPPDPATETPGPVASVAPAPTETVARGEWPPPSGEEPSATELASGEGTGIPEPIEAYLRRNARELRLESGNRLRRSDYSYPLRRVQGSGVIRVGSPEPQVRPVSDTGRAVIAF